MMEEQAQEKVDELINKFENSLSSKESAKICIEEILNDLKESFEVSKDLHPHAEGLIADSLSFWMQVKNKLDAKS